VKPRRSSGGSSNPGLGNVDAILQRQAEKRAAGRTSWVKVSDDEEDPTIIRAYDVDEGMFREGYIHQVEFEIEVEDRKRRGKTKKITIRRDRMCLDQDETGEPCPGCRDDLERRFKFWLPVIERDAPVVTDSGKITDYKDRVALLSGGSRLVTVLQRIQKKKGLVNQDVELTKSGDGFNVQYAGETLDRSPLSADDKQLIKDFDAKKKLDRYTEVYDFDHFFDPPGKQDDDDEDDEDVGERSRRRGSSFGPRPGRGRAASQRDDDDSDDDEPRQRRRRSSRSQAGGRKPGRLAGLGQKDEDEPAPRSTRRRPPRRR
jgi:hypothetical protein